MTPKQALSLAEMIKIAFPRKPLPDESVSFYAVKLAELDYEVGCRAVSQLSDELEWYPSVAQIKRKVRELASGTVGAPEAFEALMKQASSVGQYRTPKLDPVTAKVVRQMGGWIRVCTTWVDSEIHWRRKEFTDLYEEVNLRAASDPEYRERLNSGETPLLGRHDEDNRQHDKPGTHEAGILRSLRDGDRAASGDSRVDGGSEQNPDEADAGATPGARPGVV